MAAAPASAPEAHGRPKRAPRIPVTVQFAGAGERAIALAIGQKPEAEKVRRERANERAALMRETISPDSEPVMMELIGLTSDGRLVQFWEKDYPVRRVNKFLDHPEGPWIKDGKYLILYRGHRITCHCANGTNGTVSVQIMCNDGPVIYLPQHLIEPMLWGYVVPDEVAQRKLREAMDRAFATLRAIDDAPSRQRGRL